MHTTRYYSCQNVIISEQSDNYVNRLGTWLHLMGDMTRIWRRNRSIGIIDQTMNIINSVYFGRYYFEVALVLQSSLLLSLILLDSDAWVNLTQNYIRCSEKIETSIMPSKVRSSS